MKNSLNLKGIIISFVSKLVPEMGEISISTREQDSFENAKPFIKDIMAWELKQRPKWSAKKKRAWKRAMGFKITGDTL